MDWIPLPIQLLFQDEKANLVPLVDTPEILLEVLGRKGDSKVFCLYLWMHVEVGRKILCKGDIIFIALLAPCLPPKNEN
jgi:hypothetical protein